MDHLSVDRPKYRNILEERVEELFVDVYMAVAEKFPPQYTTISELVYRSMYDDLKIQLIEEAIGRKDYDLFGMTKDEFLERSYRGEINDAALIPYIDSLEFHEAMGAMLVRNFFVLTLNGPLSSPLKEVW